MKLFISSHNDDESLFGAYTIARECPVVLVVFDSYIQPARGFPACNVAARRFETELAVHTLTDGKSEVRYCGLHDDADYTAAEVIKAIYAAVPESVAELWAPARHVDGHLQHELVAIAAECFIPKATKYTSYSRTTGRVRTHNVVHPTGEQVRRKLLALTSYVTQIDIEALGCRPWFTSGLDEYYE